MQIIHGRPGLASPAPPAHPGARDVEVFCLNIALGEVWYQSDRRSSFCRKGFTKELYPSIYTHFPEYQNGDSHVLGLSPTARIERPPFHRGGSASTRGGPAPSSAPVFLSLSNLARRDLTGGADLGVRPPAAGSLHRAG